MTVNGVSIMFCPLCHVNKMWISHCYLESLYWPPFWAKENATLFLPHFDNERQQSDNDFWSWMLGNLGGKWSQTSINEVLPAFICWYSRGDPAIASQTITSSFRLIAATQWSWPFQTIKQVKTAYIDISGHLVLCFTIRQCQVSLTIQWSSFSRLGRQRIAFSLAFKGGQYNADA
jgi:hypothetical protein